MQQKATRGDQRRQNRRLVLQCIVAEGSTSRADIARTTGLTAATVSDLVAELVEDNIVHELGTGPSAGGKPPTLFGLNSTARSVIAIDLSDGGRTGAVLQLDGSSAYRTAGFEESPLGQAGIDAVTATIDELITQAPAPPLGIGVGTPGVVDDEGNVIEASNLGWRNVPLADILEARYNLPVHIVNNSRATALAEYSFGEHEAENMLVIKIGRGIGAGVVLDGRIHGGEDAAAGEIGHVVVDYDGPHCFCGKRGCLETVAAVPYLMRALAPLIPDPAADARTLFAQAAAAADGGDTTVAEVIEAAARNLARVLATTVAVLDVHRVVITGPVEALGHLFLARVASEVESTVLSTLAAKLDLCYGHTGDRAVRMGAAAFVLNRELGVV